MRVLVTGAAGFLGGYLIPELLNAGHEVVGVDNLATYGRSPRSYEGHARYRFVVGDATDSSLLRELVWDCDQVVAAAGLVGGVSSFFEMAYDLLATNERIIAATFDAAIDASLEAHLDRIVVLSSSLVYESATVFPTPENHVASCPPPVSTFGFQKLATEYFARGAWEQYRLPYTILRLSNVVGVGERRPAGSAGGVGNVKLALYNTVPDLVLRILRGEDPVHVRGAGDQMRPFTYAGDAARGIRMAMEADVARNDTFNISSAEATSVLELAERIWTRIHGPERPFRYVSDTPPTYDVPLRRPDVRKARALLGFEAATSLDEMLDEIIGAISADPDAVLHGQSRGPAGHRDSTPSGSGRSA